MKQDYNTHFAETAINSSFLFRNSANEISQNSYASPSSFYPSVVRNKILKSFGEKYLGDFLRLIKPVYLEQGEICCEYGDKMRFLYFPESAVFSEYQILEDGKTIEIAMTGCEGMLGTAFILNSETASNWSQILISGTAFKIDVELFRKYSDGCPDIQPSVFEFLTSYIKQISQRVTCHSHHTLAERLCSWILMIQDRCQTESLALTQEKIAVFLGTQRPSVTTTMHSLKENEMIQYKRGKIFIRNRQKLELASCSCYQASKIV